MRTVPPHLVRVVEPGTVPEEAISLAGPIPEGWIPINSTWIAALRYHPDRQTFDLRTRAGAEYPDYPGCGPEKFRELLASASKGQWMARHYPPLSRRGRR